MSSHVRSTTASVPTALDEDVYDSARGVFAEMTDDREALALSITGHLHDRIPELGARDDDRGIFAETHASVQANVDQMLDLLSSGAGPDAAVVPDAALDYARGLVLRRIPLAVLLRAYRLGHSHLWEHSAPQLMSGITDEAVAYKSLETSSAFMFGYIDTICGDLVEAYQGERDRWVRSAAAVRAETVRDILEGGAGDQGGASLRLGYELGRHHVGMIFKATGEQSTSDPGRALEREAMEAAALIGGATLMIPAGASLLWAWCGTLEPPSAEVLLQLEAHRPRSGVRLAIGRPSHGVDGFRITHREALDASRFWSTDPNLTQTVSYRAVEVVSLLALDTSRSRRFVSAKLGPLAMQGEAEARLRATLLTFLAHGGSHVRAARQMHVHQNTVYQRIRRAEEILGRKVNRNDLDLHAALLLIEGLGDELVDPPSA